MLTRSLRTICAFRKAACDRHPTRALSSFIDRLTLELQAGHGGAGHSSFTRPPNTQTAPPDGGHGGRGGDIYLACEPGASLSIPRAIRASDGTSGGPGLRHGRSGESVTVSVPPGVRVTEQGVFVVELSQGENVLLARGGNGGRGNSAFKSSRNRAPRLALPGERGQMRRVDLELRMIAHVGLVGLPNAGKSTLLRAITRAKPKVAAYPFTTLRPEVGVIPDCEITIADIPGLIDGASENRGLGHGFLRHVERTRFLVFVVDLSAGKAIQGLGVVKKELELFQSGLGGRRACVVGNKMDLNGSGEELNALIRGVGDELPVFPVSAKLDRGVRGFVEYIKESVE